MSLLPDYALNTDPLDERKKDDLEGLYKSATKAYEDVIGQPVRGLRAPDVQIAAGPGFRMDDLLAAQQKVAQAPTKSRPTSTRMDDLLGLTAAPPAPEQGNFSRGLSVSGKQLRQTAYGTAALIGDTLGSEGLKEWGLKGYKDAEKEVQAISKESDSFTNAWEKGEMGKWLTYSSGYLLGQVAEMGVASLAGAAIGSAAAPGAGTAAGAVAGAVEKGAVQAGVRSFVGKMIDKQAAETAERMVKAGVAKELAEKAAVEAATKSVYRTIGARTANTFLNATGELGSIYGDAVQEALDKGQDYSLGRVWLAGIAATAVDSWADSKALGKFMGALGGDKAIKGVAMEALKGGFREGMTEGVQTAIERWGADKDLTSKDAFKEYIDSAAVGILGGSVAGGASGAINKFTTPADTKGKPLDQSSGTDIATTSSTRSSEPVNTADLPPITQRELMDTIGDKGAVAYLHSIATPEQKKLIEMAVDRAGPDFRQNFDAAVGRQDMIDAGSKMLAEAPVQRERLFDAIEQLAVTQPKPGKVKVPMTKPITEQERLAEMDAADQALMAGTAPATPAQESTAPAAQQVSQPPAMPNASVNAMPDLGADVTAAEQTFGQARPQVTTPAAVVTEEQRAALLPYFQGEAQRLLGMKFSAKRKDGMDTLANEMRVMGFSTSQINELVTKGSLGNLRPENFVQLGQETGSAQGQEAPNLDDINAQLQDASKDADRLYSKEPGGAVKAVLFKDLRKVFFSRKSWARGVGSKAFRALELHELGAHYSLERMVGEKKYAELLADMRALRGKDKAVDEAYASVPQDTADSLIDEEALGYLIENYANQSIVKRLMQMILDWYQSTFKGKTLTTSELYSMTVSAYNRHHKEVKRVYLNGNISTTPKSGAVKVDFQKALTSNPEAHRLLDLMSQFGSEVALAGSLSIAPQMSIYRPSSNQIHDLDFRVANKDALERIISLLSDQYPNGAIASQFSSWRTDADVVSFTLEAGNPKALTVDLFIGRGGSPTDLSGYVSHPYVGADGQQKSIGLTPAKIVFDKKLAMNRLKDVDDAIFSGEFETLFSKDSPGKKTVSDLPSALKSVMGQISKNGVTDFKDVVAELMKRMRASKDWSGLADQVTPAMLRQSYNNLPNFDGKQSAEEVKAVTREELAPLVKGEPSSFAPAGVQLTGSSPYLAKDQRKADQANKFIGRGSERSSTAQYARDFGALANSGSYSANDVVFVSAEGNRAGRAEPDFVEIGEAMQAGATILTDDAANRNRPYNIGERQVAQFLTREGYNEVRPGVWKPVPGSALATKNNLKGEAKPEPTTTEQSNKLDLEIIAENKRLEEKYGKDWTKTAPKVARANLERMKERQKGLAADMEAEAVARSREKPKASAEEQAESAEPEVDFGLYKRRQEQQKPSDPKPKLPSYRQTETLRKLLGGLSARDTNSILRGLAKVSDDWIDSLDSPGVYEYLSSLDGLARVDAILNISERDAQWMEKFGRRMTALSTDEAKSLLDFKSKVYRIMNLVNLSAPEIVQKLGVSTTSPNKGVGDKPTVQEEISTVDAAEQAKMFRDTIAKMQAAVDAIDAKLRGGRVIKDKDGKVFEGIDEADENAYLWGDRGFRTQKDLPQDRLLAIRRGLVDDIREMQTRSTRGIAALFKNASRNAMYMLEIERREAIKNGIPEMVVNPIIEEATQSLRILDLKESAPLTNIPSLQEALQKTLDDTPFDAFDAVQELADGIRNKTLSQDEMFRLTSTAIRSGRMNYGQLVKALRDRGLDIPQEMISTAPMLASQVRMLDYVRQHGGNPAYRQAWLTSMDELIKRRPSLLKLKVFTEAETTAYELWKERQDAVLGRRESDFVMENSKVAEEAFRDLLFVKYSLSQMRGEVPIPEREAASLKGTIGDLAEAWFQDVDFALRTRPDLEAQLLDKEDGLLAPTDVEQFRQWQQRQERVKQRQADSMARIPYFEALNNIDGALPKDALGGEIDETGISKKRNEIYYNSLRAIARARIDQLDQVLANAHELYSVLSKAGASMKPSILEQKLQEFLEVKTAKDQMINGQSISEFFGMSGDRGNETQQNSDDGIDFVEQDDADVERNASLGLDSYEDSNQDDDTRLRTGFFSGTLTAAHVQAHVARIVSSWKSAPQITVLQNATLLPEPLRARVLAKLSADVGAKGVFDSETGMVYLFSDHLAGDADTEFTLFHEVYGHLGMRGLLGAKFDSFLENMYRVYPGVRKAADALIEGGTPKLEAIEEVLADAAGANDRVGAVKQFVGRVVSGLREIGLGRVADWIGQITNAELAYTLSAARDFAQNGGYKAMEGMPGEIRLAEARLPYELFSQKGDKTTAYARFNPVTQTWALFRAIGEDIRDGYQSTVHENYEEILDTMRKIGKLERRKRSGLFVDDKLPGDMPSLAAVTDPVGVKRWMRDLITKYQNEYKPVFDVVDYLRSKGRINEQMDVKTALMLYERRTGAVVEFFRNRYVEPLRQLIDEAAKAGADYDIVNTFLLARHAKERNEQIARINKDMPDKGSGMYTKDAEDFLKETEGKPYAEALNEIGRLMDRMSTAKLRYQVNTGMITRKAADAMEATYRHYVNLSGQNDKLDKFDDPSTLAGGSKFNIKGKEARAYGRSDPASDILARTVLGMEAALIRGQKNLVAQRLLAMLEANYDPNFAVVNEIAYRRQIGEDGMVMETEDADYIKRKDVMVAKVNGIPVTMRFKDTSPGSFADAIHGMVYPPEASPWINTIGRFNQFLGQLLTTYNPAWAAVNFTRDAQTMYFNAASDGRVTRAQAAEMVRLLPTAIKHAYALAFPNSRLAANLNIDPEIRRVYDEMKREGGLTSFLNLKDLEAQVDEIHVLLHERTKLQSVGDKFNRFLDAMKHITTPMEIAPRLAAYKVMRDNGFSAAEAAKFSGEITVNFNMRGSNKEIRKLYLFFNPAVQGAAKMVDLIQKNPGRVATYASAFIALGAVSNLLGRALSDDDESGRNALDKVPTYKRATSIVLAADVPGAAIPIPYGWNAFYALGHFMMDSALGIQPVSVSAKRAAKAAFEAFTPLGTAGLDSSSAVGVVAKGLAPTVALPIVEWMMNENRFGAPIRKEGDLFGGAQLPNSEMAFRSVSPISQAIATGLNELSVPALGIRGGNRARAGTIDVNPAAIDFVISSYLPGLPNEAYKFASTAVRAAKGEEVKNTPLPLIDRFTAKTPEGFDAGAFRRAKELAETRYKEFELYPDRRDEIRQELPGLMRAKAVVASTTQELRKMRSDFAEFERNPRATEQEIVERKNRLMEREKAAYQRAVKAVMEAGPEFREAVMAGG